MFPEVETTYDRGLACFWVVLSLSLQEIKQLSWQWYAIAVSLVAINVLGYVEGRIK